MKKIVCLGGGNAMPRAVLHDLKKVDCDLTVVSAMLDSGGSSGKLREDFNIVATGDIRRSLIELSELEEKETFDYRFENGHNLGNLIIAFFLLKNNSIDELNDFFKTKFKVLPSTLDNVNLCAKLKNGEIVLGETNIDIPAHDSQVAEVFLNKEAFAYKEVENVLKQADAIIIGPGDLYSSLAQIFLVKGISGAIKKSNAKLIYICNLEVKKGETDDFTVLDFANEIEKYLKKSLDYIIYNNKMFSEKCVKINKELDRRFIGIDLTLNSKKLIDKILKLI